MIEVVSEAEKQGREPATATEERSGQQRAAGSTDTEPPAEGATETDEPLNIRENRDPASMYIESERNEDIEVTFTRIKRQLQREDITLKRQALLPRDLPGDVRRAPRRDENSRIGTETDINELLNPGFEKESQRGTAGLTGLIRHAVRAHG